MSATARKTPNRWKPFFLVTIYRLARVGMGGTEIAQQLGVAKRTFFNWQDKLPEVREAMQLAASERDAENNPIRYIYDRLSPELKVLWDNIARWEVEENGVQKIELMLADAGKRVRQQLFLHYLAANSFSPSTAMGKLRMYKQELDDWINNDPDFGQLVVEMEWHKANLYETKLVQLVKEGVPQAVLFANKTFNRKRGYAVKSEMDVHVDGQVLHGVLDLAELLPFMSEAVQIGLLEAIRKREEEKPRVVSSGERLAERISELGNAEEEG